jgi:DNA polymerase-3 subunit chi
MTEVRFYHLRTRTLEQALPEILEKAMGKGHRAVVRLPDEKSVERMNDHLWIYRPDSFLPHGSRKDGNADLQPIWLTDGDDNPNRADMLVLAGVAADSLEGFSLCCDMLDGNDEDVVSAARERWKNYKDKGFTVTYWQQTDKGGWEKKA